MRKMLLAAGAALAVVSTAAFAAVAVDDTGHGFVGKGDVQLAFGWNNAQLQSRASGVTFTYAKTTEYSAVCTWVTGEGTRGEQTHNVSHSTTTGISSAVSYDARTRNQITGFLLNGFTGTPTTTGGSVPVVGGACPGNPGTDGTWTSVTEGASTGGLFVNWGGTAVSLPNTPVL